MLTAMPQSELWPTLAPSMPQIDVLSPVVSKPIITRNTNYSESDYDEELNLYDVDSDRPPPDFKSSFGNAIAAAVMKQSKSKKSSEPALSNSTNGGGKKKKNKKTILFSTGNRTFNGN